MAHVDTPRLGAPEIIPNLQAFREAKMGGVGFFPQHVQGDLVDAVQNGARLRRQPLQIGDPGEITLADQQGAARPVRSLGADEGHACDLEGDTGRDLDQGEPREPFPSAFMGKDIGEEATQLATGISIRVDQERPVPVHAQRSQIIETKSVIRMHMSNDDSIEMIDAFSEGLRAKIRCRVHQNLSAGDLEERGTSTPLVAHIVRTADGTTAAHHGNAIRRSRSQEDDLIRIRGFHRCRFRNGG